MCTCTGMHLPPAAAGAAAGQSLCCLLMLGGEGNQLPKLSLGILCLQVPLQSLLGLVTLGEGVLEAGDEAAHLPLLLEVATFRLQGCFLQLFLLLQLQDHGLELLSSGSEAGYLLLQLLQFQNVPHDFSVLLGATLLQLGQLVFQQRNLCLENLCYLFQAFLLAKACSLFFSCPCDCALEEIAQRGCGVSLTRDVQEPSGSCDICSRMTLLKQGGLNR